LTRVIGGLSGHQGALRSAFLIKTGLGKEAFIGMGVVCAALVDFSRLIFYGVSFFSKEFETLSAPGGTGLIAIATPCCFSGIFPWIPPLKKGNPEDRRADGRGHAFAPCDCTGNRVVMRFLFNPLFGRLFQISTNPPQ